MKNRVTIIIIVLFGWEIALGQNVTIEEAKTKAYQFYNSPNRIANSSAAINTLEVMPLIENNDTLLYFVKSEDCTIIVPGVKCLPPILGCTKIMSNVIDDYFRSPCRFLI